MDNFARPVTQITDKKNNTIAITPKRPVPKIEETNLFKQLQSIFPDVDQTIKRESETFKEKIDDLDKIIEKVSWRRSRRSRWTENIWLWIFY